MDISYNWLKELIATDISAEAAATELTRIGHAVEGLHSIGEDTILDIDLTSNRPDCLSHLGIARELSASTGSPLGTKARAREVPMPPVLAHDIVRIDAKDICYRFTARIIHGVRIGPSPKWLSDRLEALGERSINNVADITNYVMLELGQPMHAFDLDKLAGGKIIVRRAKDGEKLTTLDDVERTLDPSVLAICDAEKAVSVAGILGGADSAISDSTVNVLLEVAYFNRDIIRVTSRHLGISSEASYRFERGVDINNVVRASERAAELICDLAGGEKREFIDLFPTPLPVSRVASDDLPRAVKRLSGFDVDAASCEARLVALGIERDENEPSQFTAPSWRYDIAIEADLVEEVVRLTGYENIAEELPPAYGAGDYQHGERRKNAIRQLLTSEGFDEAISYSFIGTDTDGEYALVPSLAGVLETGSYVTLQNSVIDGALRMRPTAIAGLLDAIRLNLNHGRRDIKLFEIGRVFASPSSGELPIERELLTLAITGSEIQAGRFASTRSLDLYDLKGSVENVLETLGLDGVTFAAADLAHLRPGRSASVSIGGISLGSIGQLDSAIAANFKFKHPVFVAELDLEAILAIPTEKPAYKPLAKYPAVVRDVTFVIGRGLEFAAITDAVRSARSSLLNRVDFVDVFEGKGLAANERALTIRLEYRSPERTLQDTDVEPEHASILASVKERLNIFPRV